MLAIVLKRSDFREYDQLISLYTEERGMVEVLARGIKKPLAKNAAALEPFAVVDVEIVSGKEIDHLTTAYIEESYFALRSDLSKLSIARYALDVTSALIVVGEPEKRIFPLLASFLQNLTDTSEVRIEWAAQYALKLGSLLGFKPELEQCLVCGARHENEPAFFDSAHGGVVHSRCIQPSEQTTFHTLLAPEDMQILRMMMKAAWGAFSIQNTEQKKRTSDVLYNFLAYHSQKKLPDWRIVDKLFA